MTQKRRSSDMVSIRQMGTALPQRTASEAGMKLTTFIPVRFKKRGVRTVIMPSEAASVPSDPAPLGKVPPSCDTTLLIALGRAFHWQLLLDTGIAASGTEIARREGLHPSTVNELLRLSLLAPNLVETLLAGRQPKTMTLLWFKQHPLPIAWGQQQEMIEKFKR